MSVCVCVHVCVCACVFDSNAVPFWKVVLLSADKNKQLHGSL